MPSPKAQGDLDYFCGMYAVVNAYQACGEKSERASEQIFDASCAAVRPSRWPIVVRDGTKIDDMQRMLRKCQEAIPRLARIRISFPFIRNTPNPASYWREFDLIWQKQKAVCAIVGIRKPIDHWIVVRRDRTPGRLVIIDSHPGWPARRSVSRSSIFAGTEKGRTKKSLLFVRSELILFSCPTGSSRGPRKTTSPSKRAD